MKRRLRDAVQALRRPSGDLIRCEGRERPSGHGAMSCRRSFDIDLAAFLRDPHARELADFVDHYPRCPWCAAEVRAWTEVHHAFAPPHLEPARLLAYRAGALAGADRDRVDRHVAGCRSCAEELRALDGFAAVEALARQPRVRASIASWVRRSCGAGGSSASGVRLRRPAPASGALLPRAARNSSRIDGDRGA
jgi:hypothetical protein